MFCNQCGHRNPPGANFCSSCGAVLAQAGEETTITLKSVEAAGEVGEEDVTVNIDELPEGAAMLLVKRGPNAGSKFVLNDDVTRVGRHPESDIFLDDITVSRRHAEFVYTDGGLVVHDTDSMNGTYVNRVRIDRDAPLSNGDEVQIGRFKLVFLSGTSPEA